MGEQDGKKRDRRVRSGAEHIASDVSLNLKTEFFGLGLGLELFGLGLDLGLEQCGLVNSVARLLLLQF